MSDSTGARTITTWVTEEELEMLERQRKRSGRSRSAQVRHLIRKEEAGASENDQQVRELVAALAGIVL